jgi:hypothetical protein
MKIDFSEEELALIQFALVHCDDLWVKDGKLKNSLKPKYEVVNNLLNKISSEWR